MSSTDPKEDDFLASFFNKEFLEAARLLSEAGVEPLVGTDPDCESYYIQRQKTSMNPSDFEIDLEDLEEVKQRLGELWRGRESAILADLSQKILELTPRFATVEEVEDVSPYIYVMF